MDTETLYQVVISLAGVGLFVVATIAVSMTMGEGGSNGGTAISPSGGTAIVAAILGFILLMALVGVWLDRQEFDS